jgi:sulfur carrier protein
MSAEHKSAITRAVRINGAEENLAATTIAELLSARGLDVRGIAVALNGQMVPRAAWPSTPLDNGDTVELVRAMQGG